MQEEEHLTKEEARAGTGPKTMRIVLVASLVLAALALAIILMIGVR